MSTALVTGGAGFIGGHVVERLVRDGWTVRVLDDLSTGHRQNLAAVQDEIEFCAGTFCDLDTVRKLTAGCEVVFHIGARASVPFSVEEPILTHHANITGTLNVLIAAQEAGVRRVVYSASSSAYGDTPTLPKVEDMSPTPLSPYAVQKLAGEHYCRCFSHVHGLETVSLRYFNVFGPRQNPKSQYAAVIPAFITHLLKGEAPVIFGDGEQSRDFCYIDNVVEANMLAASAKGVQGEAVNIACGERVTLNDIVRRLNELLGTSIAATHAEPRAGDVRHSLADIAAAQRVIGYQPLVMFDEGLQRAVEWYRSAMR